MGTPIDIHHRQRAVAVGVAFGSFGRAVRYIAEVIGTVKDETHAEFMRQKHAECKFCCILGLVSGGIVLETPDGMMALPSEGRE
ncbi:MAG: hypothetical protein GY947_06595 [Rhodobacteraceae bacterium]|nr:hypothetical protein [Paracoccaceae bacterium]